MEFKSVLPISRISRLARRLLKATSFWEENGVILREFKYFRRIVVIALLFTFLSAVFEGFGISFLLAFLKNLTEPNAAPVQTGLEWVDTYILAVQASPTERFYRISFFILSVTLLRAVFTYISALYSDIAQFKLVYHLRLRVFEQFQALSLSYFAKTRSGELINSITNEISQVMQAFNLVTFFTVEGSTLAVYLISMCLLSWKLTLMAVLLFSLLSAGISTLLGRVREASFERSVANGKHTAITVEFINGIRTVHAFAAEEFERKRFYAANQRYFKAATKAGSIRALVAPLSEGTATIIIVAMLIVSFAVLIPSGQLQVASLLTFLFILLRMLPTVKQLNGAKVKLSSFYGPIANLKAVLRTDDKPYLQNGRIKFVDLERTIEFRAVDFGYEPDQPVLNNITLTIERGETVALVGSSGAGKSTLVDLIPRFYDPTQGQILLDGIDLKEFEVHSLRRNLAIVSQDTFIFNDSVRNNIAYAMEEVDDSAVWEAARLANALDFIQALPDGFDTILGDRGVRLSGGQRQRIAIARALLRNPKILILDEATSALDSVSERLIQESIEKLSVGRTVIAIAHRLSTVVRADKVVVLEHGRIVEQGTYQELLRQKGKLWNYHQIQHELNQTT